jgi:hypothetical protein
MGEFDFLTPIPKTTVSVKLPSRGVLYRDDTPARNGKITLTPMTMLEEAVFAEEGQDLGTAIDKILKRCVQENLDINTLLGSDKFFLFMMLRAVTYGPEYTFEWTCPKEGCDHLNVRTVKIPDDFKMKYLADEDTEPFVITLPESGKEIAFRLMRGHDEPVIKKHTALIEEKKRQGVQVLDTTNIFRLARHIIKVDGNDATQAPEDLMMNFVSSLSAKDRQFLGKQIRFYTPGLDTGVSLKCDNCGSIHDWDMPFTADFFRAVSDDDGEPVADEVRLNVLPGNES